MTSYLATVERVHILLLLYVHYLARVVFSVGKSLRYVEITRCCAFVCAEEHERFHHPSPRPCPRLCSGCTASVHRGSRCSAFVCAEEHERFHHPPAPAQDYVQGAHGQMTGDEGAVQAAMLQGV